MTWSEIYNHQSALKHFRNSVANDRLGSTYLFVGKDGVGKHRFAVKLAQSLLCENPPEPLSACGNCPSCVQVRAGTHPDLIQISKPVDKAFIPLELLIGKPEHRRQSGLCHEIGLKPFRGGAKIAIINDADFLNVEGANALLKTLEEPPPRSLLILIGGSEQQQLSTIVSRSQTVRFDDLKSSEVEAILKTMQLETSTELRELARVSGGSASRAIELANDETYGFRKSLREALSSIEPGKEGFVDSVLAFVESAGKDSARKRTRMLMIGDLTIEFCRQLLRCAVRADDSKKLSGGELDEAEGLELSSAITKMETRRQLSRQQIAEAAGAAIERTVVLQADVRANATLPNIVPPWLRDVARAFHGEQLLI